jgi:ZIP family zinc transporter
MILVFLIIDVFSHAWESVGNVAQDTYSGKVSMVTGIPTILALFGGLAIGLLGLVFFMKAHTCLKRRIIVKHPKSFLLIMRYPEVH